MNQGELAMAWVPNFPNVRNERQYLRYVMDPTFEGSSYAGTVFTDAFIRIARQQVFDNEPISSDEFLENLRTSLSDDYKRTKAWVQESNSAGIEAFMMQQTQTLTLFDDRGVALP